MFNLVWWYAGWKGRLLQPECDMAVVRPVLMSYVIGPVAYLVGVLFTLFNPTIALVIFVLVPIGYFFEGPVGKVQLDAFSATD